MTLRVLSFFGDEARARPEELAIAVSNGDALLPLDLDAIAACEMNAFPYSVLDDWISDAERANAYRRLEELQHRWIAGFEEFFQSSGICWPRYDHLALHHYWSEVCIALAYLAGFSQAGIRRLAQSHNSWRLQLDAFSTERQTDPRLAAPASPHPVPSQ